MKAEKSEARFDLNKAHSRFVRNLLRLNLSFRAVEPCSACKSVSVDFDAMDIAREFLRMVSTHTASRCKDGKAPRSERNDWKQLGLRIGGLADDGWTHVLVPNDDDAEPFGAKRLAKWLRKLPQLKTFGLCVTFPETDLFFVNECLGAFIDEDDEDDEAGPDDEEEVDEVEYEDDDDDDDGGVDVEGDDDGDDEEEADEEEAFARYESGQCAGRWWGRRKADRDQLARLAEFQEAMEAQTYGDFDPFIDGTSAYGPDELTYFALEPDDVKDRTASQWFWRFFFNNDDAGAYGNASFVKGFIAGALEPTPVGR